MRDEMDARAWVAGHDQFSASVERGVRHLIDGFERLQRIEYAAPWRRSGAAPSLSSRSRIGLSMIAGIGLTIALGAGVEPASAAAPAESRIGVSYADLNLAAAAGRATLDARVRQAARRLCSEDGVLTARSTADTKQCMAAAIRSTRPQIEAAVIRHRAGLLASRAAIAGD